MDVTFRNTPWGDITILDSWPQWQKDMWLAVLGAPPKPPFLPTYEEQHYVQLPDSPPMPLNPEYYATEATAIELMRRFGASSVQTISSGATPPAFERWLVFPDGIAVNAGSLASEFTHSREDLFPHVAENAAWKGIAVARARGQRLPQQAS